MKREAYYSIFPTPAAAQNPHCDMCGDFFVEGDKVYVGMIATGELVNVSDCCRASVHSVFSEREYWAPAEEETMA